MYLLLFLIFALLRLWPGPNSLFSYLCEGATEAGAGFLEAVFAGASWALPSSTAEKNKSTSPVFFIEKAKGNCYLAI